MQIIVDHIKQFADNYYYIDPDTVMFIKGAKTATLKRSYLRIKDDEFTELYKVHVLHHEFSYSTGILYVKFDIFDALTDALEN